MSTEQPKPAWTPSEARLVAQYARPRAEKEVDDYETAKADAERGIAKIKADALREAESALRLMADDSPYVATTQQVADG